MCLFLDMMIPNPFYFTLCQDHKASIHFFPSYVNLSWKRYMGQKGIVIGNWMIKGMNRRKIRKVNDE